jgi:hypothetical protein
MGRTTRTPSFEVAMRDLKQAHRRYEAKGGMGHANLLRARAASDLHNRVPNLGKSLTHHQVIPAVKAVSSNAARTDIGKVVLSATGGHPVMVAGQALRKSMATKQISPHDHKEAMKEWSKVGRRPITPQYNSISGLL